MLFYMLQRHSNIKSAIINDINGDLTTCYKVIRDTPKKLVESLEDIQTEYYSLNSEEQRKQFFLQIRDEFNSKHLSSIRNTTLFIFLNRTCFNGLYRVNKSGLFNVPFGKYEKPTICDPDTIYADSELLQNVEIMTGDYQQTKEKVNGRTFFYLDPPYRPLSSTSSFTSYAKKEFDDDDQRRLHDFCISIDEQLGIYWMLSNADCSAKNPEDIFFETLYSNFYISRVYASRAINANPNKRGKLTELLISNYPPASYGTYAAEEL